LGAGLILLVFHHPQLLLFSAILLVCAVCYVSVISWLETLPGKPFVQTLFQRRSTVPLNNIVSWSWPIAVILTLMVYIFIYTNAGEGFLTSVLFVMFGEQSTSGGLQSKQSWTELLLTNPELIIDAVKRLSYILSLSLACGVAAAKWIHQKKIDQYHVVILGTLGVYGTVFIIADVLFTNVGLSINRFVLFISPLLLVLLSVRGFELSKKKAILLTFLIISSGLFVVYPSEYNESVSITSNQQQVQSVRWVHDVRTNEVVVGARSTYYKIQAIYGRETAKEWNIRDHSPTETVQRREADYSWQVTTNQSTIYFVDAPERQIARMNNKYTENYVSTTGLRDFRSSKSRIYSSGTVRIYMST
jgi:hypothetical protein